MRHNSILKKLIISIAAVIVLNILSVIVYWSISASESNNSFNNPFDCGIVFFHSVTKQGNLSNITKERCNLAVKLYNNGTVKNILCVGGASLTKAGSKFM